MPVLYAGALVNGHIQAIHGIVATHGILLRSPLVPLSYRVDGSPYPTANLPMTPSLL